MPVQLAFEPSIFNYRFGTTLSGRAYLFDVRWNGRDSAWYFDILTDNEVPVRMGIKLVLGAALGASPANPLSPDGALLAFDLSNEGRDATFDDLGTRVVVYFYSFDEIAEFDT